MRLRPTCCSGRDVFIAAKPPLVRISGYRMKRLRIERTSMIWNTFSSCVVSRPAIATISIKASQPAIHSAALGLEGVRSISKESARHAAKSAAEEVEEGPPVSATSPEFATRKYADAVMRCVEFQGGSVGAIGAMGLPVLPLIPGGRRRE